MGGGGAPLGGVPLGGVSLGGASLGARKALCKPHLAFSETKLSLPPGSAAHPVQNSPSEPQNADFGPLFACRENFVPLPPPTTRAGRTLSRMQSRFRYKTLPASGLDRPTRYKTLPARPKTPISAHFSHAGRTLYRLRHQHDEQGEKSHAPTPHRTPTTCPSPNFACNSIE